MNVYVSPAFVKARKKLVKKNLQLQEIIKAKIQLFLENPKHPSLRLHKLTGKSDEEWSISFTSSLRMLFYYLEDGIMLTDIGAHDEVY